MLDDSDDEAWSSFPSAVRANRPEPDSEEDQPVPSQQFERILRRLSVGPKSGSVAQEFKSFSLAPIPEVPASTDVAPPANAADANEPELDDDSKDELMLEIEQDLAAVHEAEAEFERRQKAMARNIRDYGRTITLKEERLRELEVSARDQAMCIVPRCAFYFNKLMRRETALTH
jgi:hypothetical protein